jgi:hypothetical protein
MQIDINRPYLLSAAICYPHICMRLAKTLFAYVDADNDFKV